MEPYRITLACRNYDRTAAIIHGQVKPSGVDLEVTQIDRPRLLFTRMFNGEFDVAEFSFAEHVYYTSRDNSDFIAIPVFPSKIFRHSFIFLNTSSKIERPEDLEGKRIAFVEWVQTAAIWIRGTLVEEYNISPKNTGWYAPQLHHWDTGGGKDEVKPRDGTTIHWLEKNGKDPFDILDSALVERKVDAIGTLVLPNSFLKGGKGIKRLFENYRDEEMSYFKKTRIFPIMHILVARKSVVEQHPDLARKLFELFVQSKRMGQEKLKRDLSLSIVWKNPYLDEEEKVFQGDPWAYGLKRNSHVVEKFLTYCYNQGVSARKMSPRDLFVPDTCDLTEESIPARS